MHSKFIVIITISFSLFFLAACQQAKKFAQSENPSTLAAWPEITKEAKPWSRWWWMGSAVDKENIEKLLREYHDAGIGGLEIAPIYGAMGYEEQYIDFLSPQWMEMLNHTTNKAEELSMGIDMTLGTGWPFGGPQVTPEFAASKLIIQQYNLSEGEALKETISVKDPKQKPENTTLLVVMAYNANSEVLELTDKVGNDGKLDWRPEKGSWTIYAAFNGKTRQMVKRAAPGGVGFTLDHLASEALYAYLNRFEMAFNNKDYGIRSFYNDSYEVYGADWSPSFFDAFEKLRGYDLRKHLSALASDEESEQIARIKSDYRETMGEMLLNNFTIPWTKWANKQNILTKNQAHGSPGNLLDLYAAVNIPECETFGSSYFPIPGLRRDSADIRNVDPDPIMLKFASSAAHISGKALTSCETFTWLGEHFKTSWSQTKPEVEQVFLSGVNHVFYHGITYSPEEVPWPGWLFYASLNLTPANSLWPHLSGLNNYITRCQSILQAGKPDNELLIYWPIYELWHDAEGMEKQITVHGVDEWLHPTHFYKKADTLMKVGYSLDFISDKMITEASIDQGNIATDKSGQNYRVLVIPRADFMPVETLKGILKLASEGGTVIFEGLPKDVPGFHDLEIKRQEFQQILQSLSFSEINNGIRESKRGDGKILLAENIQDALKYSKISRETLTDTGLKFIRRAIPGGKYYYLVNHSPEYINQDISLNVKADHVLILDPQSEAVGKAKVTISDDKTNVKVQLKPGEALILEVSNKDSELPQWQYLGSPEEPIKVHDGWSLEFVKGGPDLPAKRALKELKSWTTFDDSIALAFSGTGEYTTTFILPEKKEREEYILDLGQVNESARVWINGEEVGILWSIPFKARVGEFLKEGENSIEIQVANLMANRIRNMDQKEIEWRKYHEINFVNINYKPFNAAKWQPMPSGLIGPVTITPHPVVSK